jgi:hypothetical protein
VGAAAGAIAALVGVRHLVRHHGLRMRLEAGRVRFTMERREPPATAVRPYRSPDLEGR